MFLEIIVFIASIILGVLIYWRESRSNGIFRGYNAFINKKETRMEATDRKGFFFKRPIIFRVLNALLLAAVIGVIVYYIPILNNHLLPIALAAFVGIVVGTYLAAALPTVKRAVDNPLDALKEAGKAGRDIVSDLSETAAERIKEETTIKEPEATKEETPKVEEKKESARDRMKRKGYL